MNNSNSITYTIQYGDTLYDIARRYNTTVDEILAQNPYLYPYNLQIGSMIKVSYKMRNDNVVEQEVGLELFEVSEEMNRLWEEHVWWTRMLLISIAEDLKDLDATKARLLRNPKDIARLYREHYGDKVASNIDRLLTEHLKIGGDLIVALKQGNNTLAQELEKKWYKNADDIAEYLSTVSHFYDKEKIRQMFYKHLELTTNEVAARLRKDYAADIAAFDMVQKEALDMAKYLSEGIVSD